MLVSTFFQTQIPKPAEQRLARGPGERSTQRSLAIARGLTDQEYLGFDCFTQNYRGNHIGAEAAPSQVLLMASQHDGLDSFWSGLRSIAAE